ncbi:hypothetical protein TNCV_1489711 [Trichonephila clavipes]|nr:hypothetical protein TNCV_1489711 [Trichonephila clavipes]
MVILCNLKVSGTSVPSVDKGLEKLSHRRIDHNQLSEGQIILVETTTNEFTGESSTESSSTHKAGRILDVPHMNSISRNIVSVSLKIAIFDGVTTGGSATLSGLRRRLNTTQGCQYPKHSYVDDIESFRISDEVRTSHQVDILVRPHFVLFYDSLLPGEAISSSTRPRFVGGRN